MQNKLLLDPKIQVWLLFIFLCSNLCLTKYHWQFIMCIFFHVTIVIVFHVIWCDRTTLLTIIRYKLMKNCMILIWIRIILFEQFYFFAIDLYKCLQSTRIDCCHIILIGICWKSWSKYFWKYLMVLTYFLIAHFLNVSLLWSS